MVLSRLSILLCATALVGFVCLLAWQRRRPLPERLRALLLAGLAGLALVFHLELVRADESGELHWSAPLPHPNEYLHHFLGTKYFPEVGHAGLYEAGVLADWEDDRGSFRPDAAVRDLRSYRLVRRSSVVADAERIRSRFEPERWESFKRELAVLRATAPPAFWHETGYFIDHGYNGTPLITAISGGLASQPVLDTATFIELARFLDLYLLALLALGVCALEGAAAGLGFAFFLLINPLNDNDFVGGAYLRYNYLVALALAFLSLRRGWLGASGAFFAVSGLLRIFPLVFPGLLLARDLIPSDRATRLRRHAKLYASFAATGLALLGVTSLLATPDGRNPWLAFAGNLLMHAETFGGNQIGLQVPLRYSAANDVRIGPDEMMAPPEWRAETSRVLRERRVPLALTGVVLVAVALFSLRRERDGDLFFAGLLMLFAAMPLAHYYYAMLGLTPLVCGAERRRLLLLAGALLMISFSAWPGLLPGSQDLRFAVFSLLVLGFLLAALAPWRGARALGAAAAAALVVVAGCGEPKQPIRIEGDRVESRALGFGVTKPSGWVFLPASSLRHDEDERVVDEEELFSLFDEPALTPLVVMSTRADPRPGIDPVVRVRVVPIKPGQTKAGVAFLLSKPVSVQIHFMRETRRRTHPDVVERAGAEDFELAGLEGARMRLGYAVEDASGARRAVEERLYHARQGTTYWWIEQVAPAPIPPELEQAFDGILASLRIDPLPNQPPRSEP